MASLLKPIALAACVLASNHSFAAKAPLSAADISTITQLEQLEDRRDFDAALLKQGASAKHPELRRRTALALARLYEPRGSAVLASMHDERDSEVLATVVWATGQLLDNDNIAWLDSLLQQPKIPSEVATEAAGAFGKIRTEATKQNLARYLNNAKADARSTPIIAEALLSLGRHSAPVDTAALAKWGLSPNVELRWRAAWALLKSRDPLGMPALMKLAKDASPEVRFWAMRGLNASRAQAANIPPAQTMAILIPALNDKDRRVQTEAIRALGSYQDNETLRQIAAKLESNDMWLAVSAAEALAQRGELAQAAVPQLLAAMDAKRPASLRANALDALGAIAPDQVLKPATAMAQENVWVVRNAAANALAKLGTEARPALEKLKNDADHGIRATVVQALLELADSNPDLAQRRAARAAAFASSDFAVRYAASASVAKWATKEDLPQLFDAYAKAVQDPSPIAIEAALESIADIESREEGAVAAFFARFPKAANEIAYGMAGRAFGPKTLAAWGTGRPLTTTHSSADYQRIVETLIVPAYQGKAVPRLRWLTTRGEIDTELNPLDAPLAVDTLLNLVNQGKVKDILFERVVPNFVDQQRSVLLAEPLQRDEISRGRLIRGRLSWASNIGNAQRFPGTRGPGSSYDTGPAAYTLGITPQPHNEGDFTALGRVTKGMDVVDKMELGDRVISVRVLKVGEK